MHQQRGHLELVHRGGDLEWVGVSSEIPESGGQ